MQTALPTILHIKNVWGLFLCLLCLSVKQIEPFHVLKKKNGLPSPSPAHQLTQQLHFLKFREGFFSQHLYLPHRPLTAQEERVLNALPGFEHCLNSSCQSGACISCFRFFPGGFDVNPFHTSNTSVLLQAFLSFLNIQIYICRKRNLGCHCALSEGRLQ